MILFGKKNTESVEKTGEEVDQKEISEATNEAQAKELAEEEGEKDRKMELAAEEKADEKREREADKGENFWTRVKLKIVMLQTVSLRDKIFFVQNLRVMIRGGLSLAAALETIASQVTNSMFKKVLMEISGRVQGGVTFSKSLERYPKIFSPLFINMIKSGGVGQSGRCAGKITYANEKRP